MPSSARWSARPHCGWLLQNRTSPNSSDSRSLRRELLSESHVRIGHSADALVESLPQKKAAQDFNHLWSLVRKVFVVRLRLTVKDLRILHSALLPASTNSLSSHVILKSFWTAAFHQSSLAGLIAHLL